MPSASVAHSRTPPTKEESCIQRRHEQRSRRSTLVSVTADNYSRTQGDVYCLDAVL